MYLKSSLYSIAFVLLSFLSFGQDLKTDFQSIANRMESAKSVMINVDVKMHSRKGGTPIYSSKASVSKMGTSSKNVLGEMEFITTSSYELKLDHEERAVLIFEKTGNSTQESSPKQTVDFDISELQKFLEENESKSSTKTKLISNANGRRLYSITGVPDISEMTIELDVNTKKIIKITYEYGTSSKKGQYVVLKYEKFQYDLDLTAHFDLTKYFSIENDAYVLNSSLKGYHIYTEK